MTANVNTAAARDIEYMGKGVWLALSQTLSYDLMRVVRI